MKSALLQKVLKPALILYALRAAAAMLIVFPVFIFISGKFGNSVIADDFWPLPSGLALMELIWQAREALYVILPLFFLIGVIYFLISQFFYGGIYDFVLNKDKILPAEFFAACSRFIFGFLKIALLGILGLMIVFLAANLIAMLFGKIFGWIGGDTVGRFVNYLVTFTGIYIYLGYLVNLRFIQVADGNQSLRAALKRAKEVFAERVRYFIALNAMAGFFSFFAIIISIYLMSLVYRLNFNAFTIVILLISQQIIVLWICTLEVFQIYINRRFIKEI